MFCELWRGEDCISVSLEEILWKGMVLTCSKSLLRARHFARCFPGNLKVENAMGPCPHHSCATVPKSSSKVQTVCFISFPGGLLLTFLGRKLWLLWDRYPNPFLEAISLATLLSLPGCLPLLSNPYCLPSACSL